MPKEPDEAVESVKDEKSFVEFLFVLAANRADEVAKEREKPSAPYGPGHNGWENGSIEGFLEAAASWAIASARKPQLNEPPNPWRRVAEILLAGKFYE